MNSLSGKYFSLCDNSLTNFISKEYDIKFLSKDKINNYIENGAKYIGIYDNDTYLLAETDVQCRILFEELKIDDVVKHLENKTVLEQSGFKVSTEEEYQWCETLLKNTFGENVNIYMTENSFVQDLWLLATEALRQHKVSMLEKEDLEEKIISIRM